MPSTSVFFFSIKLTINIQLFTKLTTANFVLFTQHLLGDSNTPICGASKIMCYNNAEDDLLKQDFVEGLTESKTKRGCNCLPACTSITYDAEISQANFDFVSLFNAYLSPLSEFPGYEEFNNNRNRI